MFFYQVTHYMNMFHSTTFSSRREHVFNWLVSNYITQNGPRKSRPPSVLHVTLWYFNCHYYVYDRLCGLVVRVSGYRYRGLGFDSRRYQILWVVVGLERGPLSLLRSIEELLDEKVALRCHVCHVALTTWHPSIRRKVGTNFADRRRPRCRYSSLAD